MSFHVWDPDQNFEYNLAAGSSAAFVDDLHALQDRAGFMAGLAEWGDSWRDAPGAVMVLDAGVQFREAVLRAQFMPIGRYIDSRFFVDKGHSPDNRYEEFSRFVVERCRQADPWPWRSAEGRSWEVEQLLPPLEVGRKMFSHWLDKRVSYAGVVSGLLRRSVQLKAAS